MHKKKPVAIPMAKIDFNDLGSTVSFIVLHFINK